MRAASLKRLAAVRCAASDAHSLPAWIYRDAEFFEREKQAIFRHVPAHGWSHA